MAKGISVTNRRMAQMGAKIDKAQKPKATIVRLLRYWKGHVALFVVLLLLSGVTVGCTIAGPYILGRAIDECIALCVGNGGEVDFGLLTQMLILFVAIYIVSAGVSWLQEYGMTLMTQRIVGRMRTDVIDKLHQLSLRYYDNHMRGSIMSHFTSDVELIRDALGHTVIQLLTSILTLIGCVVVMVQLSWQLTLATCATVPLVILLSKFIINRTRKYFTLQQTALGNMNGMVEESISGLKVIRSFGQEESQIKTFEKLNADVRATGVKAQIYSGLIMPLMRVLDNTSYILVTIVGATLAYGGSITVGVIQSFLLYTRNFQRPINSIATQLNSVQSAIAGAERIFRLLDETPEITDAPDAVELAAPRGHIEFSNVHFGYNADKEILHGITFTAEPDEVVAVVGSTGAGKTTIINLLTRFYDITEGSIRIDGKDIRQYTQHSLRNAMSIVLQEPYLFSESVRYNIAYGNIDASDDTIALAAKAANADKLIDRLPSRYDTTLREQGADISHGQRQLLTIARAVCSDAPILIFDEATSNIDTRTEILIQKAINNLTRGRTCIIIAHRLSTIKNADKILVIDNGQIVEQGTHAQLISPNGVYSGIYNSQFAN
ncbi:MAG: ABC transporter ATP-binding protein [Bacteroidales bacterium]|nr:ABC transporter ATP-binding protein [Bacteroidales bacterium]